MLMDTRQRVDFSTVPEAHRPIDARLVNWARWSNSKAHSNTSPMFRLYRTPEHWGSEQAANPVDSIDAQKMQKAVSALPGRHRLALSWCYIKRNNPRSAAQMLGVSLADLLHLINDARQMLINRRA